MHGTETVLVVDDEIRLLTMSEMILSDYGYNVLTAGSGEKALAILSAAAARVDLVVTDLVMPGMGGRELVERIRQTRAAHANFMHERLCAASGQTIRHAVFAEAFHQFRVAGQGEARARRARPLLTDARIFG